MVSDQLPWKMTLNDRVESLEGRNDRLQFELHELGAVKIEFQRAVSRMMDKLDLMIKKRRVLQEER